MKRLEKKIDECIATIYSYNKYVKIINSSLTKGGLSMEAMTLYNQFNSLPDNISLESNETMVYKSIVTLEDVRNKSAQTIIKLIDSLITYLESVEEYFKDLSRMFTNNYEKADILKVQVTKSRPSLYDKQKNRVKVKSLLWLCYEQPEYSYGEFDKGCKYQLEVIKDIVSEYKRSLSNLENKVSNIVNKLESNPKGIYIDNIKEVIDTLNVFMFDSNKKVDNGFILVGSSILMAGKQYQLKLPLLRAENDLRNKTEGIEFTADSVFSKVPDPDEEIIALTKSQTFDLLTILSDLNRQMYRIGSDLKTSKDGVSKHLKKIKNIVTLYEDKLTDADFMVLQNQVVLVCSTIKTHFSLMKETVSNNQKFTSVGFSFAQESMKVFTSPTGVNNEQ